MALRLQSFTAEFWCRVLEQFSVHRFRVQSLGAEF